MDIRIEKGDGCRRTMHVSAAAAEVAQETDSVMDEFRQARVPGFRTGKAPPAVIRRRFQKEIADATGKRAATRLLREALGERDMERVGPARFTAIDLSDDGGLTFTVEFDLMPSFEAPDIKAFAPQSEATDDNGRKDELSEYLLASTDFELPKSLVDQEAELAAERGQGADDERLRADAGRRVKLLLILQAIARAEGIEVDDRDVDDRISQMAADSGSSPQALRTDLEQKNGLERLALFLLAEQTMDYILSGEWQAADGK